MLPRSQIIVPAGAGANPNVTVFGPFAPGTLIRSVTLLLEDLGTADAFAPNLTVRGAFFPNKPAKLSSTALTVALFQGGELIFGFRNATVGNVLQFTPDCVVFFDSNVGVLAPLYRVVASKVILPINYVVAEFHWLGFGFQTSSASDLAGAALLDFTLPAR
jgi:hypothetical protein